MRMLTLLLLMLAPCLLAEGPEFEAASIKPFEPPKTPGPVRYGAVAGGPGTTDPTHITMSAMPLRLLLMAAFDVKYFQLVDADSSGSINRVFDFKAVVPAGATKAEVNTMWQNLLVSRFGLKYHVEPRESQVDQLVVGPKGHKLIENNQLDAPVGTVSAAAESALLSLSGITLTSSPRPNGLPLAKIIARAQPIGELASLLSTELQSPVIDKTGLTAKYDFTMEYLPRMSGGISTQVDDSAVDVAAALQQQLGLLLIKSKGKIDIVVIDKIDRTPTEN